MVKCPHINWKVCVLLSNWTIVSEGPQQHKLEDELIPAFHQNNKTNVFSKHVNLFKKTSKIEVETPKWA